MNRKSTTLEIPKGYALVPIEPTQEMLIEIMSDGCRDLYPHIARPKYDAMIAAAPQAPAVSEGVRPIPMLLFCPKCGAQHIDAEEWQDDPHDIEQGQMRAWGNPPHRSHLCHACGTIWRPADVPTTGVASIETRGKADTWSGAASHPTARAEGGEAVAYEAFETWKVGRWFADGGHSDQEMCSYADAESAAALAFVAGTEFSRPAPATQPSEETVTDAARDVLAERQRQVMSEGWTPEHDDEHDMGELAHAAAWYSVDPNMRNALDERGLGFWPWAQEWWKPSTPRRDLVKAGALILAEIERIDRASSAPAEAKGGPNAT